MGEVQKGLPLRQTGRGASQVPEEDIRASVVQARGARKFDVIGAGEARQTIPERGLANKNQRQQPISVIHPRLSRLRI